MFWEHLTQTNVQIAASSMSVLTSIAAIATFIWSYQRWKKEQKWKRKEALFAFLDSFQDTPGVRNAVMMLDIKSREIPLWDKANPEQRYVRVTWDDIAIAFERDENYNLREGSKDTAIRDSFNDLFNRLNRLHSLYCENLINKEEISDVIRGWMYIFSERDTQERHIRNIRVYLADERYNRIHRIFLIFNFDIWKTVDQDREAIRNEQIACLSKAAA